MTHRERADKIKEQWRPHHAGGCRVLSAAIRGEECTCVLCLADDLAHDAERLEKCMRQAGLAAFIKDGTPEEVAKHLSTVARSHLDHEKTLEDSLQLLSEALRVFLSEETDKPYMERAMKSAGVDWEQTLRVINRRGE